VVRSDQKVAILDPPIPVNDEFVETVTAAGNAEERFRFADKCIQCGCKQWTGSSCGVMDALAMENHLLEIIDENLPACAIRPDCRWYSQEGAKACMICPYVVTQSEKSAIIVNEMQP
jgi:hypothetical protein